MDRKKQTEEFVIEVSHVSKRFKVYMDRGYILKDLLLFANRRRHEERLVLNDVSFKVRKGEAIGLIGHNGCGKSTMLKLLNRITYPSSGKITSQGRISSLIELGAGFHPDLSGKENIYINASIFGLTKKEIDSRLEEIIDFSELRDYIDNPVRTYSSGMYMRLAFSIAINVDADILLIDEILAVGDANFQAKCFDRLRDIKNSGVTIVIVSHDMHTVQTFCDTAAWINKGKLQAYGNAIDVVDTYLSYMNDQRIEDLNKEKEAEEKRGGQHSQKNILSDAMDKESTVKKESEKDKIDYSSNHFGIGRITITEARILDADGKSLIALKAKSDYKIEIRYKNPDNIRDCVFGIGIYSMDKQCIMGNNTQLDRYNIQRADSEGVICCTLKGLSLLTGQYILNVAVVGLDGVPYDFYRDYMHFNVVSEDRSTGIMSMEHFWSE